MHRVPGRGPGSGGYAGTAATSRQTTWGKHERAWRAGYPGEQRAGRERPGAQRRERARMSEPPVTLRIRDREHEFPVIVGTEGEQAIDIAKLRAETSMITLD